MKSFQLLFVFLWFQRLGISLAAFGCVTFKQADRLDPCSQVRLSSRSGRSKEFSSIFSKSVATKATSKNEDGPEEIEVEKIISKGWDENELSDVAWENIETGEPPKLLVLKELLGINIFTYILAAAIAFFLGANFILGPGWLGQALGWEGAGTFTDVSKSLPDTVNVNDADFLF